MNKQTLRELQEFIASCDHGFNMDNDSIRSCRTPVCIAGHAAVLWSYVRSGPSKNRCFPNYEALAKKLDIPKRSLSRLTHPRDFPPEDWRKITRLQALGAIDSLLASNGKKVVWPKSDEESDWVWSEQ